MPVCCLQNGKPMLDTDGGAIHAHGGSLHPSRPVDRPHILYCQASGKYVCWLKLSGEDAYFTVLSADYFLGPYCIERDHVRPFGTKVGDFDLWQDENGRGYLLASFDI